MQRFVECKVRFKHEIVDRIHQPTLDRAAIGLVYEVIAEVKYPDGFLEERRTTVLAVFRIEAAKIVSGDLVLGRSDWRS